MFLESIILDSVIGAVNSALTPSHSTTPDYDDIFRDSTEYTSRIIKARKVIVALVFINNKNFLYFQFYKKRKFAWWWTEVHSKLYGSNLLPTEQQNIISKYLHNNLLPKYRNTIPNRL